LSSLAVEHVRIRAVRILSSVELEPGARVNVITGDNGQGKTSLLEAVYLALTSRSFRTEQLKETLQVGAGNAVVEARVRQGGLVRTQKVVLRANGRSLSIEGKRPARLVDYATATPVIAFQPADLNLVAGSAALRRRLLDRLVLYLDPVGAQARLRFQKGLRERQRLLETRGPGASELDAYETVLAAEGARLSSAREYVAAELGTALALTFSRLAPENLRLSVSFQPGGTTDPVLFAEELGKRRHIDCRRKSASFGPQRDELALTLDGRDARHAASQGQQRVVALSLKLAELECVRRRRGVDPVLLLDDVTSELDRSRVGAVHTVIESSQSQVFVTTTDASLFIDRIDPGVGRADFSVVAGQVAKRP
jgi:DNA replication and repair protein RecF